MGISNALSGFVSQILSYNQDTARISLFCKQFESSSLLIVYTSIGTSFN